MLQSSVVGERVSTRERAGELLAGRVFWVCFGSGLVWLARAGTRMITDKLSALLDKLKKKKKKKKKTGGGGEKKTNCKRRYFLVSGPFPRRLLKFGQVVSVFEGVFFFFFLLLSSSL